MKNFHVDTELKVVEMDFSFHGVIKSQSIKHVLNLLLHVPLHNVAGKKSDNPRSPDYIPSIFKYLSSPERRRKMMQLELFHRTLNSRLQRSREQASSPSPVPSTACPQDNSKEPTVDYLTEKPEETTHNEFESDFQLIPGDNSDTATLLCSSENCKKNIKSLEMECQALRTENMLLKQQMKRTELNETSLQNNDQKVHILTGLRTYSLLMTVFHFVAPYLKHESGLTLFQQLMLALLKLRMNLSFDFLAYYFGVDSTSILKIFKHCISVMHCRLVPSLLMWPDRESLKESLPHAFRNSTFEKTICIIDCFEIFIEKPSNLLTLESHHTVKYLIAICPQGSICFISNGWGGRTSNKFITEQSNFLPNLLPGDLVLADRGFNIKDSVHSNQPQLQISAFTRGKTQLHRVKLEDNSCLESLRIHIERVIRVLRQKYTVLQSSVPVSFTDVDQEDDVTYLDKIVQVCCALTNVSESVVLSVII